ncbi:hypothetical protein P3T76_006783 [Phytophthora citrophthora]|uniref:DUF7492 domain-containing protein n=1 Tax=Phytophthora citrophthora TaxID=4793 RepID=A0AAD9GNL5_9STRA|nr:hypothetical protein P3T76_006783 [Phytophthora citrophthora]
MRFVLTILLLFTLHNVVAHTWIDCFDTDRSKIYDQSASYIFGGAGGNGFCEGYGAGYPGRGDSAIGTEYTFKMLENEVEAGTAVCETVDADTYSNTDWRKRLSVGAGIPVYFAYLPNGHIVKDKKAIGTQHGVYWTGKSGSPLTSTLEMTQENLINGKTLDYDDRNCGETYDFDGNPGGRAGDGWPCIGSFVVPAGTAPGIYSMVWFWTFWLDNEASYVDQSQARGYFGAAYSTCFEVEVTSSGNVASASSTTTTSTSSTNITRSTSTTSTAYSSSTSRTAAIYKASATFSSLAENDTLAGVHAESSSGSQGLSDVSFDNATVGSDGSAPSSSKETVGTLADSFSPRCSSALSIVMLLLTALVLF